MPKIRRCAGYPRNYWFFSDLSVYEWCKNHKIKCMPHMSDNMPIFVANVPNDAPAYIPFLKSFILDQTSFPVSTPSLSYQTAKSTVAWCEKIAGAYDRDWTKVTERDSINWFFLQESVSIEFLLSWS